MLRKLFHILALGLKELNSIRADPILLALTIYTFSYAVYAVATGAKIEVRHVSTAVVDEDHSELSQCQGRHSPAFFRNHRSRSRRRRSVRRWTPTATCS